MNDSPPMSDEALISLLQEGDNSAYEILYNRYASFLFGVILRIVQNRKDAENILQDCFVKIWLNISHFQADKGRFATWLARIARNLAIDYTRSKYFSQKKQNQALENIVWEVGTSFSVEAIGLQEVVKNLKPECKDMIEWMYFEGYTQLEIADKFQIPLGTVKTRTRIALRELRKIFHEKE